MLVVAGAVSIMAVLLVVSVRTVLSPDLQLIQACTQLFTFRKNTKTYHRTHIVAYLSSLLIANVLQAIGTILNAHWISKGGVFEGGFCSFQGEVGSSAVPVAWSEFPDACS